MLHLLEIKEMYTVAVRKRPLSKHRCRMEDNIKIDSKEIGREVVN